MPKINDLTNRPGGPQPTDEFWLASAGGAADFKSTIAVLTAAVLNGIDHNEFRRFSPNARVTAGGAITQFDGRIGLSVAKGSTGVYTITNYESRVFETAVVTPEGAGTLMGTSRVGGLGTTTLTVSIYNSGWALADIAFQIHAELQAPD